MVASITRRDILVGASAMLAAGTAHGARPRSSFVRANGTRFTLGGSPHRVAGTNMWYAAYLGAAAPVGNRDRLKRELDRLAGLGIDNVRILGSSEFSPLKNSVRPTFRNRSSHFNETLLRGLDHALAEMAKRNLTAVIYLTNFWEWSGGMMTYLYWTNGGRYINMNDPAHPWPEFPDMSSEFYGHASAVRMFDQYVRAVVGRRNTITGRLYRDDPTIFSWQLANEPRPGGSDEAGHKHMKAYLAWIDGTARLIKSIDPNHMVSTGSEGTQGCINDAQCVIDAHSSPAVDYVNAGTIEFLLDKDKNFYFLEMNTRLQVEHPITEMVTGIDIVKEQIRVARGRVLSYKQEDVKFNGHAIECRINAEDPYNNFMPSTGRITHSLLPTGPGVRVDTGVYPGFEVTPFYDPMIAKLIVWGETRAQAILRMRRALEEYRIVGVRTNIPFHQTMMDSLRFMGGQYDTRFVEERFSMDEAGEGKDLHAETAAILATLVAHQEAERSANIVNRNERDTSNWKWVGRWERMHR